MECRFGSCVRSPCLVSHVQGKLQGIYVAQGSSSAAWQENKFSETGNVRSARISQPTSQSTIQLTNQLTAQPANHRTNSLRILAMDKEIRQFSSGRVVNMPKIKEVTTLHELEAIIRGVTWMMGWGLSCAFVSPVGSHEICSWRCSICESAGMVRSWLWKSPSTDMPKHSVFIHVWLKNFH